ncbi:hypothetical protein SRB5_15890 [Streptomyces sp. RB5]|uniref:Uncharacterized protein n=1 Tax=Streptomyces smaragdinus TaxID=2585196 RepID=A0A7K0CDD4_9ACTN|nr:hypothetical protein [Streptomyces smaragdinus]MQY11471.1 hypothetical protein [Streptomyces smaragdinus]
MLYNYLLSLARTAAPVGAGWLITQALRVGVDIDSAPVESALTAAFSTVYYALFRFAELHLSQRFGWLLGWARPPKYEAA